MPAADLGSSFDRFFNAAAEFFRNLSEINWTAFAVALLCLLAMQLARAWAWRNVLKAAYPAKPIPYMPLAAAYLAGAGINAVVPAHAGDVTKVFLVKRQIPDSSYPAVTSSFLVQTVFDTSVGLLVLAYAITQGLLPPLPRIPDLPAFEISFWAENPKIFAIVVAVTLIAIAIGIYFLAHRVRRFWDRVKQGLVILDPPPIHARGLRLAGDRLALPLRRLLVLPRGLRDRRLDRQRDAGDERAGDRQHRPLHPGRRRRPAGAARRHPARADPDRGAFILGRDPDRDGGLVDLPRLRRDPARLPHHRLARPHKAGPGRKGGRRRGDEREAKAKAPA